VPLETEKHLILFPRGFTSTKSSGTDRQWDWIRNEYPAIAAHLELFKEKAEKRCDKGEYWWELRACDYYNEFEKPKMILPDISLRGNFALDQEGEKYCVNTAYIISSSQKYLLGILNSALITFVYKTVSSSYRGGYLRFIYQYLVMLPIRLINFNDPADVARHHRMVNLVDQMLTLNKKLAESKVPQTTEMLKRQIESTDRQIDRLVYELYDLTEEEIKIVEAEK
jgi:type II restriction/modification system DNA methylase subunit YeeA